MADKKQESATEDVDIDGATRAEDEKPAADPEATVAVEDAEAPAESEEPAADPEATVAAEGESEDSAEETSGKAEGGDAEGTADASEGDGGGGDDIDLDLMDIFTDEEVDTDSLAGTLDQFLEELTMQQVADEADGLLEEFRAI